MLLHYKRTRIRGNDLLVAANWEKIVGDSTWIAKEEVPEITGLADFVVEEKPQEEKITKEVEPQKTVENKVSTPKVDTVVEKPHEEVHEVVAEVEQEANDLDKNISEQPLEEDDKQGLLSTNVLVRNILLVVVLLLVLLPVVSFVLRKRK